MNFLLSIDPGDYGSNILSKHGAWETFLFGGQMLLIGLATVFAVLIIIWVTLILFKVFAHDIPSKRKAKPKPISESAPSVVVTPKVADDAEIIAVISAAIAAAESESAPGMKFRVVSFKRK